MNLGEPDELLPAILGICEDFFASTDPAVHRELEAHLRARSITGGPGWLVDMLALNRMRLQTATDHAQRLTTDGTAVETRGD